jgi:hypothetical protein
MRVECSGPLTGQTFDVYIDGDRLISYLDTGTTGLTARGTVGIRSGRVGTPLGFQWEYVYSGTPLPPPSSLYTEWFNATFVGADGTTLPVHDARWLPITTASNLVLGNNNAVNGAVGGEHTNVWSIPSPTNSFYVDIFFEVLAGGSSAQQIGAVVRRNNANNSHVMARINVVTGDMNMWYFANSAYDTNLGSVNIGPLAPGQHTFRVSCTGDELTQQTINVYIDNFATPLMSESNALPNLTVIGLVGPFSLSDTGGDYTPISSIVGNDSTIPPPAVEPGIARTPIPVANSTAGSYSVVASSPNLNTVPFALTNGPPQVAEGSRPLLLDNT